MSFAHSRTIAADCRAARMRRAGWLTRRARSDRASLRQRTREEDRFARFDRVGGHCGCVRLGVDPQNRLSAPVGFHERHAGPSRRSAEGGVAGAVQGFAGGFGRPALPLFCCCLG